MNQLASLPVAVPLLVAAILAGAGYLLPRRVVDPIAIFTAGAIFVICLLLMHDSAAHTIVYWMGAWKPDEHHFPVGICFMIDPLGAGLAALVALLMLAAFTFSRAYFKEIKSLYHALMLVFLAAMCGLCLTGDLFNMFVWFELMTATAVGLCGYESEEKWPLLGSLNFAVINTVAAFLTLTGIAVLYAYTGSLNMSQVAQSLALRNPGTDYACIAFVFVCAGFLVKAAVAPFHFWLADAHTVAPTPVCVLFSGVMVELGLYAVGRLYWLVFSPVLAPYAGAVRDLFLCIGVLTAVVGAVYCFGQRHFKRLLAFSTISHMGLMCIGLALLSPTALAGLAIYVVGHGLVKGALFICAGIFLHRFQSVDEFDLRGRGKKIMPIALLMLLGAIGLAGLPPFATFCGEGLMDRAAHELHLDWIGVVAFFAEAMTAGAVLRVTARVFLGWGPTREATSRGAPHILMGAETSGQKLTVPWSMWAPPVVLLALAVAVFAWPAGFDRWMGASERFEQSAVYQSVVLRGIPAGSIEPIRAPHISPGWRQVITALAALALALAALFPQVWGKSAARRIGIAIVRAMRPLRSLQSGRIGDYVAWFIFGIAAYGGVLLLLAR